MIKIIFITNEENQLEYWKMEIQFVIVLTRLTLE